MRRSSAGADAVPVRGARRREWADRQHPTVTPPTEPGRPAASRFTAALRGYDRHQVDDYVATMHREIRSLSERLADSELRRARAERGVVAAEEELAQHIDAADADARYRNDHVMRVARRAADRPWADPPPGLAQGTG